MGKVGRTIDHHPADPWILIADPNGDDGTARFRIRFAPAALDDCRLSIVGCRLLIGFLVCDLSLWMYC